MANCSSCGATLNDASAFCETCGKPIGSRESAPVVTENTAGSGWTKVPSQPVAPPVAAWTPAPSPPPPVPSSSSGSGWSQVPSQSVAPPVSPSAANWMAPSTPPPTQAGASGPAWSQVPNPPAPPPSNPSAAGWTPTPPTPPPTQAGAPSPGWSQVPNPTAAQPPAIPFAPPAAASALTPNVAAALAYLLGFITGILFLVMEPYKRDRFVRFHATQSILFCAAWIIFQIGWRIVWALLINISGYLYFVGAPIRLLISLGLFFYWLYVMYQAYQQKEYRVPIIGAIAAQQAG